MLAVQRWYPWGLIALMAAGGVKRCLLFQIVAWATEACQLDRRWQRLDHGRVGVAGIRCKAFNIHIIAFRVFSIALWHQFRYFRYFRYWARVFTMHICTM